MTAGTGPPDGGLRSLAAELDADRDRIAERITAAIIERVPIASALPAGVAADVRVGIKGTLVGVLALVLAGRPVSGMADRIRGLAEARADAGIPLEQSLLAYQVAAEVLLDEAIARLSYLDDAEPDGLATLSRRVLEFLQMATAASAAGYQQVAVANAVQRERDLQDVLAALAAGRAPDPILATRVGRYGVDYAFRWAVALRPAADSGDEPGPAYVRALRQHHPQALIGRLDGWVVLLLAGDRPVLSPPAGEPTGVAEVTSGPAAAIRQATRAARVAAQLSESSMDGTEAAPLGAVLDLPADERAEFARGRLAGVLASPRADELLATLAMFLAHGMARGRTARALHVHRHTLDNRLTRIAAELGDPAEPTVRLQLELALFLLGRYPPAGYRPSED